MPRLRFCSTKMSFCSTFSTVLATGATSTRSGSLQDLARQLRHLGRHGGREEHGLTLLRQQRQDATDRRPEALVEHLVGLIENQRLDPVETRGALVEVVLQAARRRDHDVEPAGQRGALRAVADAAEHHADRQAEMAAIGLQAVGDLGRQFARGGQDERPAAAAGRPSAGVRQAMQQRQAEGRGLAGAGLGDAQQVTAVARGGDRLRLDRGGGRVAFLGKRLEDAAVETESVERQGNSNPLMPPRRGLPGWSVGAVRPAWWGRSWSVGTGFRPTAPGEPGNGVEARNSGALARIPQPFWVGSDHAAGHGGEAPLTRDQIGQNG